MSAPVSASPTRSTIRTEIKNNVNDINNAFSKGPGQVNLSAINNNIKQLGQTNAENNTKIEKNRSFLAGKYGTWTIRAVDGFAILFAIGALVTSIWLAIISGGNPTARRLAIAGAVLVTGAGAWQVVQSFVGREVSDAQDEVRDDQLKTELEQRLFQRFAEAFEQYRNTDRQRARDGYRNCMSELKAVPDEVLTDLKLPPKPMWVESAAVILKEKDPENDLTQRLNSKMETIVKASTDKKTPFSGEQGHNVMLEPISRIGDQIQRQFNELEELTGLKLPYISLNGKFYDREGRIFDTVVEAEANTKVKDAIVIDLK